MAAATEEEIEEAVTVGDGGSDRANCRGRGNGSEGEKGSQRGRDGVSRPEVAEDLDALSDSEIVNGKDVAEEQSGGGDHGRGLVDNSEDGDGKDGRRTRRVGEEEQREKGGGRAAQVNGGRGERREGRWSASIIQSRQLREMGRDKKNGDGAGAQRG